MHERNRYTKPPNFGDLANKFPELKPFVHKSKKKYYVDFRNAEALRALSRALLKVDFQLDVELPIDRLIPTIPLRLNYIHWLEDLIGKRKDKHVFGIDIGTGASCIYPLLSARMNGWNFIATEIDEKCINYARQNVSANGMEQMIKIIAVKAHDILCKPLQAENREQFDFSMCNPPFFVDTVDAKGVNRTTFRPLPSSVCTGDGSEIITEGGEIEFVKYMIEDSLRLRDRVKIYTSMLGKKSSLKPIIEELKARKVKSYTTYVFSQGKTARWAVAWSFTNHLPQNKVSLPSKKKEMKPLFVTISDTHLRKLQLNELKMQVVREKVNKICEELQIILEQDCTTLDEELLSYTGTAYANTWIHQRRKRRLMLRQIDQQGRDKSDDFDQQEELEMNIAKKSKMDTTDNLATPDKQWIDKQNVDAECCVSACSKTVSDTEQSMENDTCVANANVASESFLKFTLTLAKSQHFGILDNSEDRISMKLEYVDGGKDQLHQLYLYFRNQLEGKTEM